MITVNGNTFSTFQMYVRKKLELFTRAALPELDPPAESLLLKGFLTGPEEDVQLLPLKHISSQTVFPAIIPPYNKISD